MFVKVTVILIRIVQDLVYVSSVTEAPQQLLKDVPLVIAQILPVQELITAATLHQVRICIYLFEFVC